jgi:hypothetical protein
MAVNEAAIAVKAMGSQGEVAKSSEAMRRAAPRDPMVPKAILVIARRKVFASTSRWTRRHWPQEPCGRQSPVSSDPQVTVW